MPAPLGWLVAGLLTAAPLQSSAAGPSPPPPDVSIAPGDRIEVLERDQTIRGRIAELRPESVVLQRAADRLVIPLATVQRIDRFGDSVLGGTAIGAAIGGGATLALMARVCSNSGCADTSSSLDPRFVLLGTLIGAGVGALVDAAFERRTTIYRAGQSAFPLRRTAVRATNTAPVLFARGGWARATDDEGTLGSGPSVGAGLIVPIGHPVGVQIAYDRHTRDRRFESGGRFFGTEQLVTAKALFFFRSTGTIRPYAGVGLGVLDSNRRSESPTIVSRPGGSPVQGAPEIFRNHTQGGGPGFAVGAHAGITPRLSLLGDLTLDIGNPGALGSTRLTVGAGWRLR